MKTYEVDVGGRTYEVDAPDENTAWTWANQVHGEKAQRLADLTAQYQAEDAVTYDPTAGMSGFEKARANLGAGFMDVAMGVQQLLGQKTGADYTEKRQRDERLAKSQPYLGKALQVTGAALPAVAATIPAVMAAPAGAATVAGGAILGGLTGLTTPVEGDIAKGKFLQTALGAATGGAANKVMPMLPAALGRAQRSLARLTGGGRQKLANEAFLEAVENPAAARAAIARYRDVPGTQPTVPQITGNQAMLGTERRLAETGGEAAAQLAAQRQASNRARYQFLTDEFGRADPVAMRQAASEYAQTAKPTAFTAPFQPMQVMGELGRLRNATGNARAQAVYSEIQDRIRAALQSRNPVEQLHQVRMFELDDRLSSLAQTDRKLASAMSRDLMGVKKALDNALDKATDGQWKPFLDGYSQRMRQVEQAEAGEALLGRINQAAPDVTGTPSVAASRQSVLRKAQGATDDFGNPLYSDTGQATIDDTLRSLDVEARTQAVRPAGSATASNLSQGPRRADALLEPLMGRMPQGGALGQAARMGSAAAAGGVLGAVTGGPAGAGLGAMAGGLAERGVESLLARQATDIAQRLFTLYRDPTAAMQVLNAAVKRGEIPFQLASQVARVLQSGRQLGLQALPAATAAALPNALAAQAPAQ